MVLNLVWAGLAALQDYIALHVLTCLIPAFLLAGAMVAFINKEEGATGLAHMFEHMAFKGTDKIGTTNYAAEKTALEKVESAYGAYDEERRKPVGRDEARVAALEKAWKDAI